MCMRSLRKRAISGAFVALVFGGCASQSTTPASDEDPPPATDLAFTNDPDQPLIDEAPVTTLDENATLIRFEATWLCELQRRTFPTPDAVETALSEALAEAALSQDDYDRFRHRVNVEQELRDAVLFAYQEICVLR